MADRWLECECPKTGVDLDLEVIGCPDVVVSCSMCGGDHRLGDIAQLLEANGDGTVRQLDQTAWRALVKAMCQ